MTKWTELFARALHGVHLDTVRKQVLCLAVLGALIPGLVVSALLARRGPEPQDDRVAQALRSESALAGAEIDEWLAQRLAELRVTATSYAVSDNLARIPGSGGAQAAGRLRDYLGSARERMTDCEALLLFDSRSRPIAGAGARMGGQFSSERISGLSTGESLIGEPSWDGGLGKAVMAFAVPIRQADGRYQGALIAKVNLRSLTDILQRHAVAAASDPGDASVMTEQGKLILKSRVSSAELMHTRMAPESTQALLDAEGTLLMTRRADGERAVAMLHRVPSLHWAVMVEWPRELALRQAGVPESRSMLAVFALLVLAALIAALAALLIVRPLGQLALVATKAAGGDTSVEFPAAGSGEVGRLTQILKSLVVRVREREGEGELERLSITDALTGLYNRRHLMGTLANEVQRSRRLRRTFSVLLADVDHFKQYNDTYGHLAGDAALVQFAEILRRMTRGVDTVARYGGEEFVVMLIEAPLATALLVAERIRAGIAAASFDGRHITASIGVAEYPTHGDTPEELIASADAALYQAKGSGRDQVAAGGKLEPEPVVAGRKRRKGDG